MLIVVILAMLALLFLSLPVAAALTYLGFFLDAFYSDLPLHRGLATMSWAVQSGILLVAVPMFILLGEILVRSGVAERMYRAMMQWLSWLPGGLMHANIGASIAIAATAGSSVATAATVSTVSVPLVRRYRYNEPLFLGSLAAGGTLGILIPPSINLIIFGFLTNTSIPALYLAGFIPGLVLGGLFMLTVLIACLIRPAWGGLAVSTSWRERVRTLPDLLPPLAIFVLVIGSIYAGWATPTESASLGVCAALVVAAMFGRLSAVDAARSDPRHDAHDRADLPDPHRRLVPQFRPVGDRREPDAHRLHHRAGADPVRDPDAGHRLLRRGRHGDGADADDGDHGADAHAADGVGRI